MNIMTYRKILLLEDQFIVRCGMKALLQIAEPHAIICEASSYKEAVNLLENEDFDLAFLDHDLKEEKSGFDVLCHIREKASATIAIMLSAEDDPVFIHQCLDAGASGYIPKGVEENKMTDIGPNGIFRRAIDTVFQGCIFLPASILGKGGHSPMNSLSPPVSATSLGLTPRQVEVLYYLYQGLPNKSIANNMNIAESTVRKDYVTAIFRVFGVQRRTQLLKEISQRRICIPTPRGDSY